MYCSKCRGIMMVFLGGAILANVAFLNLEWWTFIGILLIVMGAIRMAKPTCPCPPDGTSKKKK